MKRKPGEKVSASILALTVAAPMCYVLQLSLGIGITGWYAFLFAAGSLLLLELIAWNRVTAIAVPAGLALLAGFIWWALGKDGREALSDFYWWALGFIRSADAYPMGYGVALTAIVSFLVTLFVWLFGRKFFCFPAVFVFVAAIVLVKWLSGLDSVLVPGTLAAGGLVLLWAKSFQRKTAKKSRQEMRENGIALYLLPVAGLMVLIGLTSVTVESARGWQNRQVYDLFERVNNYMADYTNFNRPRNIYSIAAYGFMPMGTRLGGPIKPPDTPVMYVSAPRRMLLRGTVYNNYTGAKWTDTTNSPTFRLNASSKAASDNAFDVNRPQLTGSAREDYDRFVEHVTISIYPLLYSPSTMFVPPRGVTAITSDKFLGILPKFNAKGEAFNTYNIQPGYGYKVVSDNLMYNVSGFDELMRRLMLLNLSDDSGQEAYIKNNYLALPDNMEKGVYDLTNDIISGTPIDITRFPARADDEGRTAWSYKGAGNDYEKALAIRAFLTRYFTYTLSPANPPEDMDFVSYFVDHDPQGYCTYFATTMAVMARIAGIPSRYVEGYMLPEKASQSDVVYKVTGKDAHAWTELYFSGIGWIPFDATPSGEAVTATGTSGGPEPTIPEPTHPSNQGSIDIGNLPTEKGLTWDDVEPYLWTLPVVVVALALLWVVNRMIRARIRSNVKHVKRRYGEFRLCCAFYYAESLKLLEYYNYPVKTGETPYAFAARIDKWLRLEAVTFAEAANVISLISYSDYKPSGTDVEFMARLRQTLAKYTYQTVGPWYYLWHQVLGFGRRGVNPPKDR